LTTSPEERFMGKRVFLSGNEAVARGAYEADCRVAASYPGTPSTEILENVVQYPSIYCEWSVNEKVALEVALGASMAGARALYTSKHVGLNVAADPFFSAAYIGARGGLVVVSADDPGLHSSQSEQDNRYYGIAAKVPVLCPSDSQEAKDFTRMAFEMSERFDIPVLVRLTTRISHTKSVVELGRRVRRKPKGYRKNIRKNMLLPAFARERHVDLEKRYEALSEYAEEFPGNRVEEGPGKQAFVCDGVAYQYTREAFPDAPILKLGMVHPLPSGVVARFCREHSRVCVVEENDPVVESAIRALGFEVQGKDTVPRLGELTPDRVARSLGAAGSPASRPRLPKRPPVLCPGCGHRGLFYTLGQLKPIITGDIGCYTLGALPPLGGMGTCVCMGASITVAHGMEKAGLGNRKVVAVIGDSTFFHSGMTGLLDVVYNIGNTLVVVVDNFTTAMTGHQRHPGTGRTLMGRPSVPVRPEAVARGLGLEWVRVVDPYDLEETRTAVEEGMALEGPGVLVARRPCTLQVRSRSGPRHVTMQECTGCRLCLQLGCPAISMRGKKAYIDETLCYGDCGLCTQVCPRGAIQ
jgi:indolepyruvate ferredoxin oxidoreductase alpha subunit